MVDINVVIANNIIMKLRQKGKKQIELADALGVSNKTMCKMLSGSKVINVVELKQIAEFLDTSVDELVAIPENVPENNVVRMLMDKVETDSARRALEIIDELADLVLFHAQVRENAESAMKPWKM